MSERDFTGEILGRRPVFVIEQVNSSSYLIKRRDGGYEQTRNPSYAALFESEEDARLELAMFKDWFHGYCQRFPQYYPDGPWVSWSGGVNTVTLAWLMIGAKQDAAGS